MDDRKILTLTRASDVKTYTRLRSLPHIKIVDEIDSQLEEIYKIRHPSSIMEGVSPQGVKKFIHMCYEEAGGKSLFGVWVWYSWIRTLVRFLPESMHTELRTSRNRNLITQQEQFTYYNARVGVAGLSVGNSVVSNILHTGGAKYLRIADSDIIGGSNLNRIRTGFDTVGLPKTTCVSREIYLTNPFADLIVFSDGLTMKNMHKFLLDPTPLHVVVDEMDDIYLKIHLRLLARKYKIPVVMAADNGDGVVIDIERYDKNQLLPLMHGDVSEKELLAVMPTTHRHIAARIISTWVHPDNIAERMMLSLMDLGTTLYTWPQLGNAASMAGSLMSYVVRRIVTHQPMRDGKIVVSPDEYFIPDFHTARTVARRKIIQKMFTQKMEL